MQEEALIGDVIAIYSPQESQIRKDMVGGWVKLHHKITEWCWYHDNNTFRVFIHLILTASYKEKPWRNIVVKRGQRIGSPETIGNELNLTRSKVRTALKHLQETGEITIQGTSQYSIITVNNYNKYQGNSEEKASYSTYDRKYNADTKKSTNEIANVITNDACSYIAENNENRTNLETNELAINKPATNQQVTTSKENKKEKTCKNNKDTTITSSASIPYEEIVKAFNDTCTLMSRVTRITDARRRAMKARWRDYGEGELQPFIGLFQRAAQSAFLNGENNRGWYADFDWLLNESNLAKVLEGKYDRAARASPKQTNGTNVQRNDKLIDEVLGQYAWKEFNNADKQEADCRVIEADKHLLS